MRLWARVLVFLSFILLRRLGLRNDIGLHLRSRSSAIESCEVDLVDGLEERLALDLGELELKRGRLAGAIAGGKSSSTPGGSTANLSQGGHLGESLGVTEGNVDDAVVGKGGEGVHGSALLTSTNTGGRDEDTGVLAVEASGGPDLTGAVPEGLPLCGEVAVTGGDTEEECVVLLEDVGVGEGLDVGGLGRSVHLAEDLLGESLLEPVVVC